MRSDEEIIQSLEQLRRGRLRSRIIFLIVILASFAVVLSIVGYNTVLVERAKSVAAI